MDNPDIQTARGEKVPSCSMNSMNSLLKEYKFTSEIQQKNGETLWHWWAS
jgi:hypothetical protein